jgi:hypothetical protein
VVRRRLTVRRLDPWSVLKFGAVANLALLAIGLLVAGVVWFVIDRLALVDQACSIALDVGFTQCGINAGNLFRALILLGLLWVVVQTAVLVFLAFLHNLIADLTGGLTIGGHRRHAGGGGARRSAARRVTTASTPPEDDPPHADRSGADIHVAARPRRRSDRCGGTRPTSRRGPPPVPVGRPSATRGERRARRRPVPRRPLR